MEEKEGRGRGESGVGREGYKRRRLRKIIIQLQLISSNVNSQLQRISMTSSTLANLVISIGWHIEVVEILHDALTNWITYQVI